MRLIALIAARNEGCYLGLTLRAALRWCDHAVVLAHSCTDDTLDIATTVAEETGRVHILIEPESTWREMAHRQRMLEAARELGATHLALVDADEILTGDWLPAIRSHVAALRNGQTLAAPMRNMWRGIHQWRCDTVSPFGARACTTLAVAMSPALAWRAANGYDHHHREPYGSRQGRRLNAQGGVMHLQFANWRRLLAKHALYKVIERVRWPQKPVAEIERTYNMAPNESGLQVAQAPATWWEPYQDILHHLDLEREPWQESEVRRIVSERGESTFNGLSLFGLTEKASVAA